jgi:hypothetical protein
MFIFKFFIDCPTFIGTGSRWLELTHCIGELPVFANSLSVRGWIVFSNDLMSVGEA